MAGIMKFFKPTDGAVGKKQDAGAVGNAAREVFSPVGNTKGVERVVARQTLDNDSDVEIMGDEVPANLKRKRKDSGHAACGIRASTNCAGVSTTSQVGQLTTYLVRDEGIDGADKREAMGGDVKMSSKFGPDLGAEDSSPAAVKASSMQLNGAAPAAAEQMLSPDIAVHQPTAKRQRVPDAVESSLPADQTEKPQQEQNTPLVKDAAGQDDQEMSQAAPDVAQAGVNHGQGSAAGEPLLATDAQPRQVEALPDQPTTATAAAVAPVGDGVEAATAGVTADTAADAGTAAAAPVGAAGGGVATGGTGVKSGGAGPSTLAPDMDLATTLESLRQEQIDLEIALEAEMLLQDSESGLANVAAASEGGRLESMPTPTQLCAWLEGRTESLSELVERLAALLPAGADPSAVRTSVVDLAQRKCYSAKDAPLDGAAASEDATPGRLWVWEVREPRKHLQGESNKDTATRKLAEAMRKRRKELRERLVAVGAAHEALSAHQALLAPPPAGSAAKGPTAAARRSSESRAAKAWNRLARLLDLAAVEAAYRTASVALVGAAGIASARKRKDKEKEREEKVREREEKAKEREEKAREREEKARQKEEEARAKEAKKAQEEEAKRKAKEVNKTGYHSNKELQKSRNIMQSFFKRSAQPKLGDSGAAGQSAEVLAVGPVGAASGAAAAASGTASASLGPQVMAMGAPSGGRGCSQAAGGTPARDRAAPNTMFDFSKLACRQPDKAVVEALDAEAARLPVPADQLAEDLRVNHQRWRQQRAARRRMIGVPPTWSRRPNAPTDIRVLASQYYGDVGALGLAPEGLRTWRRKLIAFPRKETVRPPYYGSFSRTSTSVTGRRPFGRDTALDYEVASDEEWEEEPEGESLSDSGDEADSQAGGGPGEGGEDEDDGFIVGDDHLSDDEGAQLSGDEEDRMQVDGAPGKARGGTCPGGSAAVATTTRFMDPRLQQLESAIDRVRSNNRPILLIKPLPAAAAAAAAPAPSGAAAPADGTAMEVDDATAAATVEPALPDVYCRLRAEPRPGLNTGLDAALLGALRPVVHSRGGGDAAAAVPVAVLAPPQELDVYGAYAAAAQGAAPGAGYGGDEGVHGSAGLLPVGGTPGGCDAAATGAAAAAAPLAAAAVAPGSARAPGSGARGRPPAPGLSEATLTALADFMSRSADQKMDKIVEGFLAAWPPATKPPAKTKLRDAIKRLGVWSAASRRWHLHGSSVGAAVEHALAMAASLAAAAAVPTPPPGSVLAGGTPQAAAAVGRMGLMPAGAPLATPTPGPALLPPGLPAPTPAPHLGPLPTPSTAPGGRPLLHAPASTPLGGETTAPGPLRPTGQVVMPQHLMQVLARLADEPPTAATPTPAVGPGLHDSTLAPALVDNAGGAAVAAGGGGRGGDAMDCDEPRAEVQAGTAGAQGSLPGGDVAPPGRLQSGVEAGQASAPAAAAGSVAVDAAPQQFAVSEGPEVAASDVEGGIATDSGTAGAAAGAAGGPADGGDAGCGAGGAKVAMPEADPGQQCEALPRPMPPRPPPLSELALLGPGHPFWAALTSWVMGGGGPAGRIRRHGPSWMDVSAAMAVFEAGELEPRLASVPLDLARVLVAVCQHRTASHLRSGAFKALGNLAAALAATAVAAPTGAPGDAAGPVTAGGGGPSRRRRPRRNGSGDDDNDGDVAGAVSGSSALRPTGQPSRCGPQPVTLLALWSLPGLLEAVRSGCCDSDLDSETDKAARGAARVLAALVGVGVTEPSPTGAPMGPRAVVATEGQQQEPVGMACDGPTDATAAAGPFGQTQQPLGGLSPEVAAAAAAFRLRVASNPELHSAVRSAAARGPGPASSPARQVFHAHMLLALQRLLRDPVAGAALLRPTARLEREAAAARGRGPPPPPVSPDTEAKWGSKMLQSLVVGGRDMVHPGCRKGLVRSAAALMDLPVMSGLIKGEEEEVAGAGPRGSDGGVQPRSAAKAPVTGGGGGGSGPKGWSSLLSGNDPRTQVPAAVLTLLVSELRHIAADGTTASGRSRAAAKDREGDGDGTCAPATSCPLNKCARGRVTLALMLAQRALRHLSRPSSRLQLRQGDTKTAMAEMLEALQEAGEVLAATYDPELQSLYTGVGALAEELSS